MINERGKKKNAEHATLKTLRSIIIRVAGLGAMKKIIKKMIIHKAMEKNEKKATKRQKNVISKRE